MVKPDIRQAIAVMIGLYIVTNMLSLYGGSPEREPSVVVKLMAFITILVTITIVTMITTGYCLSGGW